MPYFCLSLAEAANPLPLPAVPLHQPQPPAKAQAEAGKGKAGPSALNIGYHDDQQKVWNGTCWSVGWKPLEGTSYTDPAIAIFADGSEFVCTDVLQGELQEKGVFRQRSQNSAPRKMESDKHKHIGTHANNDIGNLYVTKRKDGDNLFFAALLNQHKKQICQVSGKNAPIEHGLEIMTRLAKHMLENPEMTERGLTIMALWLMAFKW